MARPPKMRLPYASPTLHLVATAGADQEDEPKRLKNSNQCIRGVYYPQHQWRQWLALAPQDPLPESLQAQYMLALEAGKLVANQSHGNQFCWDGDSGEQVEYLENEFQLLTNTLDNLNIETAVDCSYLTVTPELSARYTTHHYAAKLGEVRLVDSQRFVTDSDGVRYNLLNTSAAEQPVLYLENHEDTQIVRQQTPWQSQGSEQTYDFSYRILQPLRQQFLGNQVHSVTVLEHYTSFFMQRALTADSHSSVWVPAYAPVQWGWSLRVERDDQDWVITRRKLIVPVVTNDGWQMPTWQASTLQFGDCND